MQTIAELELAVTELHHALGLANRDAQDLRSALVAIANDLDRICARCGTDRGSARVAGELRALNARFKTLRVA